MTYYVMTLTGHRPQKLGGFDRANPVAVDVLARAQARLLDVRDREPDLAVVTGLALGWDQWVADICSDLSIPYAGAAPCREQSSRWPDRSKADYQRICRGADPEFAAWLNSGTDDVEILARNRGVVYVHDGPYPGPECMQDRNVWMVDRAAEVLACFDGTKGGTRNCVQYARKHKVPVYVVNPTGPDEPALEQTSLW